MADGGRWFKLWCSCINDPDLDNLSIADFGRWAKLGALIKEHGTEGKLSISDPARAVVSALQYETFNDMISCLRNLPNLNVSCETNTPVSYSIKFKNWHKYQQDLSTGRVRKFRAKNAQNETPKKRGEERRGEEKRLKEVLLQHEQVFLEAYPGINLEIETAKAQAWLDSNPKNKKSNLKRFLNNWFTRAQENANRYPPKENKFL